SGRIEEITAQADPLSPVETIVEEVAYLPFSPSTIFGAADIQTSLASPHLDGLAHAEFGNGLALDVTYDADGQITDIATGGLSTDVQDLTYGYDDAGNITSITDTLDGSRTQVFTYDDIGRLSGAAGAYGDITYDYDLVGNRTQRVIDTGTVMTETYTYGSTSHRLSSVTVGSAIRDFTYTAAGSVSADDRFSTGFTFAYNHNGRMASVSDVGGTVATYLYNAREHRVAKTVGSMTTHFVYDAAGHLIAESDGATGDVLKEYIWLGDTPVALIDHTGSARETYFIHADHLGRPQKITDDSQIVVWAGQFEPFGQEHSIAGSITAQLMFPGQYYDPETRLSQNWHREYDATLGRYVQGDPIGVRGLVEDATFNTRSDDQVFQGWLYAYANATPQRLIDPSGLRTSSRRSRADLTQHCGAPPDLNRCLASCAVGGRAWENFCRTVLEPRVRAGCWAVRYSSEAACRGWCFWNFTEKG
ncbi:MAG TPA: RHS repeat-associated core domain-containing protein, partial [Terriglobales bacterium]|nr:RHS repeat-associated core domain-containing protein [Terriglobales bacterium]